MSCVMIGTAVSPLVSGGSSAQAAAADYVRRLTAVAGSDFPDEGIHTDMTPDGGIVAIGTRKALLPGDTNNRLDVYVIDRVAGTTELASVSSAGVLSSGAESHGERPVVSISDDGDRVVFTSTATNLVGTDTNGIGDIFVRDRSEAVTWRVSVSSSGAQAVDVTQNGEGTFNPDISGNGRYVTFDAYSDNLVTPDVNGSQSDVFVHDLSTSETRLVSVAADGTQPPAEMQTEPFVAEMGSGTSSISQDGRYVAFASSYSTLTPGDTNAASDVFVKDLQTGALDLVSSTSSGVQGNRNSFEPQISADASVVAFTSRATNFGSLDTSEDVFVKKLGDSQLEWISSFALQLEDLGEWIREPVVSDDGRFVVFEYDCGANDMNGYECPFGTYNGHHVYRFDRQNDSIDLVSSDCYGRPGTSTSSSTGDITAGGRLITFNSSAPLSGNGDTAGSNDAFIRDMDEPTCAPEINMFPILLSLEAANFKEVFLLWTNEGIDEDHYQLQRAEEFASSWTTIGTFPAFSSDNFSYRDRTVRPGKVYTYRVRAVRANGTSSGWSNLLRLRVPEEVKRYVAMGDSYSSGEGVEPYFSGTAVEEVNECHRSTDAYSTKVVTPGTSTPLSVRAQQGEPGISWDFIACSGAVTTNVIRNFDPDKADGQYNEPTQIAQNRLNEYTDLVTISIGGNDAKFGPVVKSCLAHACTSPSYMPLDGIPMTMWLPSFIDSLVPKLQRTMAEIRAEAPYALVVVLGYPHLFPSSSFEQSCGELFPFGNGEMPFLNQMGDRLNQRLEAVAAEAGFSFVNPTNAFSGHEICGGLGPWIQGIDIHPATFHPRREGQAAYAQLVNDWLVQGPAPLPLAPKRRMPKRPSYGRELHTTTTTLTGTLGDLRVKPTVQNVSCGVPNGIRDGSTIRIRGGNFAARARVDVWLGTSGPDRERILVSPRTDTLGNLDVSVVLANTYGIGLVHSLEAKGTGANGGKRILLELVKVAPRC